MDQEASRGEYVAASETVGKKKLNVFARMMLFFRQVINELSKVVAPTRSELVKFTMVVLGFVLVMMAFVFGLDWVSTLVTQTVFGIPE